jgi:leucyl/phenylalanyl-tRNA--protein transferase
MARMTAKREIDPDTLLKAYAFGVFPMAQDRDDPTLYWMDPDPRGILPLDDFHIPHRLARTVRSDHYQVRVDTAFTETMQGCAAAMPDRRTTWINDRILALYTELFSRGFAHSVECWEAGELVGGLYGVALGGAFFGESMFSRARDASKVALVHLLARLVTGGYSLLDTQYTTEHLSQFGTIEIPRSQYRRKLRRAISEDGDFYGLPAEAPGVLVMQSLSQKS